MNTQSMVVDPQELVIDLPLNETKVVEYMQSLSEHGLIQEVVVWLKDNRIIDGFHRTEAAKRLGWTELRVAVKDIDEEAFWNARIISARSHHDIEPERLAVWMGECWKQTKWYVPLSPDKNGMMPRVYSNTSLDLQMVEMIWTVFAKKLFPSWRQENETFTLEERELRDWVLLKSQQWNVSLDSFTDMFLRGAGIRQHFLGRRTLTGQYDDWAREYNLTLKQRLRLQQEMVTAPKNTKFHERIAEKFIEEKIAADLEDGETYLDFVSRKIEEERAEEQAKQDRISAEHQEKLQDPNYQRHLKQLSQRAATEHVSSQLQMLGGRLRSLKPDLIESPQGKELFAAFIDNVSQIFQELWPQEMKPVINNEAQQVAELKRKLKDAERENGELRRALNGARKINPLVMATSSTEIESMVA